ncbi:MAG TPA: hypothetical protein VF806_04965 [Anaerolineaceae bacterium]
MPQWEFCKVERQTIGSYEHETTKGRPTGRASGEKFTERMYVFRMTAQRFTPDGLQPFTQTEEYKAFLDDPLHNQMGEKLLAKLGQEGWEPFFTDTRSSQNYFIWHLKKPVQP